MASTKKKVAPASSSKPVRRKDGTPTRAEKRRANKEAHAVSIASGKKLAVEVVAATKEAGRLAAGKVVTRQIEKPTKVGRPWAQPGVEWTDELGDALFALISTGHSMREISEMEGMPPLFQMLRWLGEETHPFTKCRARGKQLLVPLYEEMAQSIAMNSNPGEIVTRKQVLTKDGDVVDVEEVRIVDNVERSKLALQGIQWSLGHLVPRKHGRTPDTSSNQPNEQLQGLFDALKAGPAK